MADRLIANASTCTRQYTYKHAAACRDTLLGNDRETHNETTPSARQQILDKQQLNYNRGTVFSTWPVPRYKQENWSSESVMGHSQVVKDVSRAHC
jgi:hypothetical protein